MRNGFIGIANIQATIYAMAQMFGKMSINVFTDRIFCLRSIDSNPGLCKCAYWNEKSKLKKIESHKIFLFLRVMIYLKSNCAKLYKLFLHTGHVCPPGYSLY